MIKIQLPTNEEEIRKLHLGDEVEISGVMVTGRDAAHKYLIETDGEEPSHDVPLGDLEALQGVVKFPVRIKCATLAWNTLLEALDSPASNS